MFDLPLWEINNLYPIHSYGILAPSVITRIPYSFWDITNTSNVVNYVLSYYEFCCIGMMYLVNCLQLLHRQLAIDYYTVIGIW